MARYFIKKMISFIATLFLISLVTFVAFSVIPGDAAVSKAGTNATKEQIEKIREDMGLNRPVAERYVEWLQGAVKGDFGESLQYRDFEVSDLVASRLPYTLILTLISVIIIIVISIPLGVIAAKNENGIISTLITVLTQVNMAVPPFFLGILMTYIFGLVLKWFQPGACVEPSVDLMGAINYLVFPAIAIAMPKIAMTVKFLKNSIIEQFNSDYVRTALGKGCSKNRVMYGHILGNALIPVITFMGLVIAEVVAGSIIIEQVFSVPGIGRMLVTAILNRDYPVVQAVIVYITISVVVVNTIVDLLYHVIDPRVSIESEGSVHE